MGGEKKTARIKLKALFGSKNLLRRKKESPR